MEQKKFDLNSLIGFALIFAIVMWMMYENAPSDDQAKSKKAPTEQQKTAEVNPSQVVPQAADTTATDSLKLAGLQRQLGSFAYSGTLESAADKYTVLENDLMIIKVANKGGQVVEATLKNYERFHKGSADPVKLITNQNAKFNLALATRDNRVLNTADLYFEPSLSKSGTDQILTMRLKAGPDQFLEYKYVLKQGHYMMDFDVRSQGLSQVLDSSKPIELDWQLKTTRNEKSIDYENRYTEVVYEYEGGKDDYLSQGSDQSSTEEDVSWIAYKQHFFTSILLTETPFKTADLASNDLVGKTADSTYTKAFRAKAPLALRNGEVDYKMNWYYGPADYKILNNYDRNLDEIIPLGWGIFGWINKFIFVPLFGLLSSFLAYGIAIIVFTILIKVLMSPVTYKSFLSQAKMKVMRPELMELNEKFKKDPMKRQQETMKLYQKAGVNPMAGCIPALIQLPFLYASFQFFPSAIELRQKSFLWADDLSSYDAVVNLPFYIPLYGDHISLFPILAAIAIFFYMKMTTGDQVISQPPQEGMPDMAKIMKIMIYVSPLMMLFFFNNYGSGLSLYNLVSNLITIAIMVVIKKYVVDEQKIHAKIQENKLKPKKQSKFQARMQELMEQAEAQKAEREKQRKRK
ncbi:MAG TPA: membrane protein insertase YidC [Flavobacterium sp.]|nr:membrane protein insertase YidC [Flavobacterium sp.]